MSIGHISIANSKPFPYLTATLISNLFNSSHNSVGTEITWLGVGYSPQLKALVSMFAILG